MQEAQSPRLLHFAMHRLLLASKIFPYEVSFARYLFTAGIAFDPRAPTREQTPVVKGFLTSSPGVLPWGIGWGTFPGSRRCPRSGGFLSGMGLVSLSCLELGDHPPVMILETLVSITLCLVLCEPCE